MGWHSTFVMIFQWQYSSCVLAKAGDDMSKCVEPLGPSPELISRSELQAMSRECAGLCGLFGLFGLVT